MPTAKTKFATLDEYIASFPKDVQAVLEKMRRTIAKAAPDAEEVISYQMPAFRGKKVLIFFSAWKEHYSLFLPSSRALQAFQPRLSKYEVHKATIKFRKTDPIPYDLIRDMTRFRVEEDSKP